MDFGFSFMGFAGLEMNIVQVLATFVVWLLLMGVLLFVFCAPLYLLLTLPMRRRDRAALLLDLVESGLRDGKTPEQTVTNIAGGLYQAMGTPFLSLSTHIQDGLRLSGALKRVPGMVSPQVEAMLEVGEETGEMGRVLPACRVALSDGVSKMSSVLNYVPVMLAYLLPAQLVILLLLPIYIVPKFQAIAEDFGMAVPAFSQGVFDNMGWFVSVLGLLTAVLFGIVGSYVLGVVWGSKLPGRGGD